MLDMEVRRTFRVMLLFCAALAASPSAAETLEVTMHKPAHPALIGSRVIAEDIPKTSRWVERWAARLRSRLNGAKLLGEKMFFVPVPGQTDGADLVMTGGFDLDVHYFDVEPEVERKCVARDADDECTSWKEEVTECEGLSIYIEGYVSIYRPTTGASLFTFGDSDEKRKVACGYAGPTLGSDPEFMLDRMLERVYAELFPATIRDTVRIRESRRGLRREDRDAFKQAIRLTDDEPERACAMFAELLKTNPEQLSAIFNVGLCAEARGDLDTAYGMYVRALDHEPGMRYALRGVERIELTTKVEQQYRQHFEQAEAAADSAEPADAEL